MSQPVVIDPAEKCYVSGQIRIVTLATVIVDKLGIYSSKTSNFPAQRLCSALTLLEKQPLYYSNVVPLLVEVAFQKLVGAAWWWLGRRGKSAAGG